jgi:hypothetical protein
MFHVPTMTHSSTLFSSRVVCPGEAPGVRSTVGVLIAADGLGVSSRCAIDGVVIDGEAPRLNDDCAACTTLARRHVPDARPENAELRPALNNAQPDERADTRDALDDTTASVGVPVPLCIKAREARIKHA